MSSEKAIIKVVGIGGGGGNAVERMIECGLAGVDFVTMNTDNQVLRSSSADAKLQLGETLTNGLGAGGNPEVGRSSAQESRQEIRKALEGADMVFITAGMGGGTGTGAAPVVAEISRELGALTVGIVTRPFAFEGPRRARVAKEGLEQFKANVDTMIVIPNDKIMMVADKQTSVKDAFLVADDTLRQGVQGITEIITVPGLVNVDFADVKSVMSNSGTALMGIGQASGDHRAEEAARMAIASPLLEGSLKGAKGLLLNITGGSDLMLSEVYEVSQVVSTAIDESEANIIFGMVVNERFAGGLQVTVVATSFDEQKKEEKPDRMAVRHAEPIEAVQRVVTSPEIPDFLQQKR